MIFNLRGSSGAGKSYIGHSLLRDYPPLETIYAEPGTPFNKNKGKTKPIGYRLPGDLLVLGRYEATCGGVEGLPSAKAERLLVETYAPLTDHLFFEGLFLSMSYGPWLDSIDRLEKANVVSLPFVVGFLNTPMEVCEERVASRRAASDHTRTTPLNRDATIVKNWSRIHRNVKPAFDRAGVWTTYIDYTRGYDHVLEYLRSDGWTP